MPEPSSYEVVPPPRHIERDCWCATPTTRIATLAAAYPDRCTLPVGDDCPQPFLCILPDRHTGGCEGFNEREGVDPCHYCGGPTPCGVCWLPVTAENAQAIADELSFSVEVARLNREEGYS